MDFSTPHSLFSASALSRLLQQCSYLLVMLFSVNVAAVTISIETTQKSPPDLSGAVVYLTPLYGSLNEPATDPTTSLATNPAIVSKNNALATAEAVTVIAQENRQFTPYIKIVQTGATVTFPNRDSVAHHVYSFSKSKPFELPLYQPGASYKEVFDSPGLVTIGCNIHDWMLSYLMVVDTPFYGYLRGNSVELKAVPAGEYRLSLWYPGLRPVKPIERDVTINDDQQTLSFTIERKLRKLRGQPAAVLSQASKRSRY